MTGKWCPYCEASTPMQVAVVIEICTDRACINTGHHTHGASHTENACKSCDMPYKITEPSRKDQPND